MSNDLRKRTGSLVLTFLLRSRLRGGRTFMVIVMEKTHGHETMYRKGHREDFSDFY